ncbi:MAG: hypothetical protein IKV69_00510 [Clostridia bacterium]|nr:hypothetical protein [Clostridia bacterium]
MKNQGKSIWLNGQCVLDTSDTVKKKFVICRFPLKLPFKEKRVFVELATTKTFSRLFAIRPFRAGGRLIDTAERGGYVEVKHGKSTVKIGKDSWIEGSVRGTEAHQSFVQKGTKIGNSTLLGPNAQIGKNVVIGDKTYIGSSVQIGKNCVIDHNVRIDNAIIGPKTEIATGTNICQRDLSGNVAIAGQTNLIGHSPNYYQKYWWRHGISPSNFSPQNIKMKDIWQRVVMEFYYKNLSTRIGQNVQIHVAVVEAGAIVGDNAKMGYLTKVKSRKGVENGKIVEDKEIIK